MRSGDDWFCHPMEMAPQECVLTRVQGLGWLMATGRNGNPTQGAGVEALGCDRPTAQAGWGKWESSQCPINQCGEKKVLNLFQSLSLIPS